MSQLNLFPTPEPHPARYSFVLAVFPDQQTARNIYGLAAELRNKHRLTGRVRPLNHLHVSLPCPSSKFDDLDQACQAVVNATPPFDVKFDRVLSFKGKTSKQALVLIGSKDGNAELKAFHRLLVAKLSKLSGRGNTNPKFTPHLTLLYDREITEESVSPVSWKVNAVVLVQSHVGETKYDRLAQWTLGT